MAGQADKLYFYSKSRDVYPGRGTNEVAKHPEAYIALRQIPRWRQILSNFSDDCVVRHRGYSYTTIEHAFQAAKIGMVDPDAAHTFALESGSQLSKGSGADAQKQRKMRKLDLEQLRVWERYQPLLLIELWRYKASHCPTFRRVLMGTENAQLWHVQSRKPAVRWKDLEIIRNQNLQ